MPPADSLANYHLPTRRSGRRPLTSVFGLPGPGHRPPIFCRAASCRLHRCGAARAPASASPLRPPRFRLPAPAFRLRPPGPGPPIRPAGPGLPSPAILPAPALPVLPPADFWRTTPRRLDSRGALRHPAPAFQIHPTACRIFDKLPPSDSTVGACPEPPLRPLGSDNPGPGYLPRLFGKLSHSDSTVRAPTNLRPRPPVPGPRAPALWPKATACRDFDKPPADSTVGARAESRRRPTGSGPSGRWGAV